MAFASLAMVASLLSGVTAGYLYVKSEVAQIMLDIAWQRTKNTQHGSKPWPWADISPVARLSYLKAGGSVEQSLIVLDNASGEAMAFGPGLVAGNLSSPLQNSIAFGGHRDTHLAFLEYARIGETFKLETIDGQVLHYLLESTLVMDTRSQQLQIATDASGLVLITCYPFNATQTGGPLRLVARARLIRVSPETKNMARTQGPRTT